MAKRSEEEKAWDASAPRVQEHFFQHGVLHVPTAHLTLCDQEHAESVAEWGLETLIPYRLTRVKPKAKRRAKP